MKIFTTSLALLASASVVAAELPITTTDVFIQSGEVSETTAIVMARCNNEVDSDAALTLNGEVKETVSVTAETDFTISFELMDLMANTMYEYSVSCTPAGGEALKSTMGSFKTAPAADEAAAVSWVWVADLAGQGWGRNPTFEITTTDGKNIKGGYVVFEVMEGLAPDFALFQGDMIYADNACPPTLPIPEAMGADLGNWTNDPAKDFIAVSLDDFRMNWKYNHGDEKMQSFLSKVPIYVQWDDHEVTNNWWPGETVGPALYEEGTPADTLAQNSLQAMYEFNPLMKDQSLYRKQRFGKHLEVFFPDYRSFRGPNSESTNPEGADMMGPDQLEWLKTSLLESTATWKIISSHDPLGIVTGGEGDHDSFGQEDPAILGRELELKDLLSHIKENDITGVLSLTTDVHFTAHVEMHPDRAEGNWTDFNPMDEFVVGPIHAGSFGPNFIDTSFGAKYLYERGPLTLGFEQWANLPPSQFNLQSFGHASVTEEGDLTVKLIGIDGEVQLEKTYKAPDEAETNGDNTETNGAETNGDNTETNGSDETATNGSAGYALSFGIALFAAIAAAFAGLFI